MIPFDFNVLLVLALSSSRDINCLRKGMGRPFPIGWPYKSDLNNGAFSKSS